MRLLVFGLTGPGVLDVPVPRLGVDYPYAVDDSRSYRSDARRVFARRKLVMPRAGHEDWDAWASDIVTDRVTGDQWLIVPFLREEGRAL